MQKLIGVPLEILEYVEDGRNPDIYTREHIELVNRGNSVINGKQEAFKSFSEILADTIKREIPELTSQVENVMTAAEVAWKEDVKKESGSSNGAANGDGYVNGGANGS